MPIVIDNSKEFERLLDGLSNDIVTAAIHLKLHKDLRDSITNYVREFNESNTFWQLTLNAHLQHGLHCLARAFDQQVSALSLRNWLETIRQNLQFFSVNSFRKRLSDNPFVDSLAEQARTPDLELLNEHIAACSPNDPLVKRLIQIRNNVLGHRSAKLASQGKNPYTDFPLTFEDIDALIDRALNVYNTYNQLFRATQQSRQIVGHDDFRHILDAVRRDRQRQEQMYSDML
jgi:hypothetical protein